VLVGLPGDATYANAREAGRALYRQTILPMASRILSALAGMLSDWMGPVKLAVDTDQISEIAEDPRPASTISRAGSSGRR
jgi:phage portal protein BeeE